MLRAVVSFVLLALAAGSVASSAAADVTLVADSYVRSDTPSTNYGTAKDIRVRGGGSLVINGYLRFTVSGVGAVSSAKLRVFVTDPSPGTGSVFRVLNNTWLDTAIVWPGPSPTGSALDSKPAGATIGTWVEYDVSAFVTGDGTYSLQLQSNNSDAVFYSSREGSNAPQLVLTTGAPSPPQNTSPPTITGTAQEGQTLTASPGTWTGTPPINFAYLWERCTGPSTCSSIGAPNQNTYALVPADVGKTVRVTVTATGAVPPAGTASSAQTATVTGAPPPTAPANTSPPTISGSAQQGQTLTASPGTWTGTPPITFAYQWERCTGPATCSSIGAPNQNTYLLVSDDVGKTIRVTVTATGAVAPPGVASSAQTATVIPFGGGGTTTLMTAGDIACSPSSSSFNGGQGTSSKCRQLATSNLLLSGNPDAVLPLGDLQYENGTLSEFLGSYDLSWGRPTIAAKTYPVSGNHEYNTSGGAGYYQYWQQKTGQDKAHQATNGYYSFDLGAWHIVVINSNCSAVGGCGSTSPQVQWLRADLQAHPTQCTLAAWHHPLFNGTKDATIKTNGAFKPLWDALYQRGAEIVLNGHVHHYQRFAPMNPSGASDPANGIREFIVGTGGIEKGGSSFVVGTLQATAKTYGVLKLTLAAGSYTWQFLPAAGESFTDAGSGTCH